MNPQHGFKKGVISGIGFASGLIFAFGIYWFVFAVSPGSVGNPTFGPQDDDVRGPQIDCIVALGAPGYVACPAGYQMTGAGGACYTNNSDQLRVRPDVTGGANGTGSVVTGCGGGSGSTTSGAVCCRIL